MCMFHSELLHTPIDICYVLSVWYFDSLKGLLCKWSFDVLPVKLNNHLSRCVFLTCNCMTKRMRSRVQVCSRCSWGQAETSACAAPESFCPFATRSFGLNIFCLLYQHFLFYYITLSLLFQLKAILCKSYVFMWIHNAFYDRALLLI